MSELGKHAQGLRGFPTPNMPAGTLSYLLFYFPDEEWAQWILGALEPMNYADNWFESGEMSVDDAAEEFRCIVQDAPYNLIPEELTQTPFWDNAEDVDDTAPPDDQRWYGYVTDPDAPAGELDFVEDASVWVVSGMIALATGSVGVALAFRTFVRNFILTQKKGDVGETIRYVIDGRDMTTIAGDGSGDLVSVSMVGDPDLSEHDFYIIKTS